MAIYNRRLLKWATEALVSQGDMDSLLFWNHIRRPVTHIRVGTLWASSPSRVQKKHSDFAPGLDWRRVNCSLCARAGLSDNMHLFVIVYAARWQLDTDVSENVQLWHTIKTKAICVNKQAGGVVDELWYRIAVRSDTGKRLHWCDSTNEGCVGFCGFNEVSVLRGLIKTRFPVLRSCRSKTQRRLASETREGQEGSSSADTSITWSTYLWQRTFS